MSKYILENLCVAVFSDKAFVEIEGDTAVDAYFNEYGRKIKLDNDGDMCIYRGEIIDGKIKKHTFQPDNGNARFYPKRFYSHK